MVEMASKFGFLFFFHVLVRISGSIDLKCEADTKLAGCENILIREFDPETNYRFETIYLISTCPKDFDQNSTIRKKCETKAANVTILEDIFLFTLALDISTKTKIYSNVYCAICNGQKEFFQFPPHFHYHLDDTSVNISEIGLENNKKFYPFSEHTFVLGNLRANNRNDELISFNKAGLRYKFTPYKVLIVPKRSKEKLLEPMRPFHVFIPPLCFGSDHENFECKQNSSEMGNCFYKDDNYSNIFNSRKVIGQLNRQPGRPANASFCPEKYIDSENENSSCRYENENGFSCWWNKFLTKGVDYVEGENGEIFFVDDYTMINMSREEYSLQTGLKNVLYLCGVNKVKHYEKCFEFIHNMQSLLRRFSILFVIFYLLIQIYNQLLAGLMEKVAFSYYITLLLMYLREEIADAIDGKLKKSCFLQYSVYRYFLQSYTFWILIATCYLWIIIRTPGAERAMNQDLRKGRIIYLLMFVIGWILPAIFIFLFYLIEEVPSCPTVKGFTYLKMCKSSEEPDLYFTFILITTYIICAIVFVQFLAACYYQFGKTKQIDDEVGCSDWKIRLVFFLKIVYSIGLYFVLLVVSMNDPNSPTYKILVHLWSFHGTLIFFLYSFKVTVLKRMSAARESPDGVAEHCGTKCCKWIRKRPGDVEGIE